MSHEDNGMRNFRHVTQNGAQLETYEWFISGIFHLTFLSHSKPWITKTVETETTDTGILVYRIAACPYCLLWVHFC